MIAKVFIVRNKKKRENDDDFLEHHCIAATIFTDEWRVVDLIRFAVSFPLWTLLVVLLTMCVRIHLGRSHLSYRY